MKLRSLIGAVILAATGVAASAQYSYTPPVYSPLTAITTDVRYQGMVSSLNANVNEQVTADDTAAVAAATVSSAFRHDKGRSRQNLRNFVTRTTDPAARANLEQMIAAQPALLDEIAAGVRGYGFDPHNVADAYAVWWINLWGASQKTSIEPDAATVAAVKRQVRTAFAATPDFAKTSDAERQEYAEALLLQAAIMGSAYEQWKNDPKMLEQLADAARKGARASGLDLSLMTLTQEGFVPRSGADASPAQGDGNPVRNARLEAAPAGAGSDVSLGMGVAAVSAIGLALVGGAALLRRG